MRPVPGQRPAKAAMPVTARLASSAIAVEPEGRHDAVRRKTARHDRRRERAVERQLSGRVI